MAHLHDGWLFDLDELPVVEAPPPPLAEVVVPAPEGGEPMAELAAILQESAVVQAVEAEDQVDVPSGFALFGRDLFGNEVRQPAGPLAERFTFPPFSVLDARQGAWQDRKRAWLSLGIQSESGRGDNLQGLSDSNAAYMNDKAEYVGRMREPNACPGGSPLPGVRGPRKDYKPGKGDHPAATSVSQKLAPGGGGGGCWLGGPRTDSSDKFNKGSGRVFGQDFTLGAQPTHGGEGKSWPGQADNEQADGDVDPAAATGTSIFDPVLTELMYRWFCPPGGTILDPFAGGSVRGIVAAKLGFQYVGIELRPEQLFANAAQAKQICVSDTYQPIWIEGDAIEVQKIAAGLKFDFVFSCPPYGDLEQYSNDPRDLSTMEWADFQRVYRDIVRECLAMLAPDRFACFVVGDFRDDEGIYRGFPEMTVSAFGDCGARKYNEAVLVTSVGSLPIRAGKQFDAGRKLGKTHQNVLNFLKGNPKRAAVACNGQLALPAVLG